MPEIIEHFDLSKHNTFGIQCYAKHYCIIKNEPDLFELIENENIADQSFIILGGGSNILFTRDFNGLVIHNQMKGIEFRKISRLYSQVIANSGENWDDLVETTVHKNLWGFENLSKIPGTVGAAPVQNIGAYGVEIKDHIEKVNCIELATGKKKILSGSECLFGYRTSIFKTQLKEKVFITSVEFKLHHQPNPVLGYANLSELAGNQDITPGKIREIISKIRAEKLPDPAVTGNAGSFFKNPIVSQNLIAGIKYEFPEIVTYPVDAAASKVAAGWLIEKCGLKGYTMPGGRAGVHHQQALVLVNYGQATGSEIVELSQLIIAEVKKKFGIELEPEVNII